MKSFILIRNFIALMLLASASTRLAATPAAAPQPASAGNVCPAGFQCCPDMSNTMQVDATQWQTTGQPLNNNTLEMAWWDPIYSDAPNPKGYITCYYNAKDPHPYTLQGILPAVKPQKGTYKWEAGKVRNLECVSSQIGDCPFVPDKY